MSVEYYTDLQLTISPVETIRSLTRKNAATKIRREKFQALPAKEEISP